MKVPRSLLVALLAAFLLPSLHAAAAELPFLSPLFGEHMVLQRGQPNRIWGWTKPGTVVTVRVDQHEARATAGDDGHWLAEFTPPPAGGPYTLVIDGPEHREFKDVLVGDVWLCSGQSNMEFNLARARGGEAAVKASTNDRIRLFRVSGPPAYTPIAVPRGEWRRCEPAAFEGFAGFSAVAYYFGRRLEAETGVPVGLIQAAVGGSPAESWMSPESLKDFPEFAAGLAEIARLQSRGAPVYGNYVMHWYDEYDRGVAAKWSEEKADDTTWTSTSLPEAFTRLGVPTTPAVVWLRRDLDLPAELPVGAAKVLLGVVEKMDTVWINGRFVGASAWVENPRAYHVPAGVLRPGRNQITLRVLKTAPDGGFRSAPDTLRLQVGDTLSLPLATGWRAALGVDARPPHPLPLGYENWPVMPTVLQHSMLHPLAPIALTGALWYQGEANFTRAWQYRRLLPAMIADWRRLFQAPELPVYIVSLPAFMKRKDAPSSDGWAELRDAQALTARTVPHTALAVTVDTGDADNIHPDDKQPVGDRLALLALRDVHHRDVVCEGPTFAALQREGNALRVRFDHAADGLVVQGDAPEFAVAGADHTWHWAEVRIEGDSVVVRSPPVPEPVAVRYAWQANPRATLFNRAGLPAVPFRTDDWPLTTQPKP